MSITYYIDKELSTVFTSVVGSVDGQELYDHQDRLRADPHFNPQMREIINCQKLQRVRLDTVVHTHLVSASPWGKKAKRAVIIPNPFIFNIMRMFQVFMQGKHGNISIFHNIRSAKAWLNDQESLTT